MSLVWIYALASVIVDAFVLYEVMSGFSAALLGLTLLAWGSSSGDVLAFVSISRQGYGEMAITGCVAGPVFNLLLGLGVTTLNCILKLGTAIPYTADEVGTQVRLSVTTLCASISCCLVLIGATVFYRLSRGLAYGLLFMYAVIIGVTIALS